VVRPATPAPTTRIAPIFAMATSIRYSLADH
jgi:hypothetical protein